MRNRMIAGNWKMNKTYVEGVELAQGLADQLADGTGDVDVVVCPPTVDLKGVSEVIEQSEAPFALGAQNVYFEESGAFTGETAPNMLEAVGATYCIIGHSERRGYFGETDEDIKGIASLVQRAYDRAKAAVPPEHRGNVRVSASVALFVPKSQTPFQWDGQIPPEEALRRVNLLRNSVKYKAVDIHWHDPATSFVEAVMSRGGRQAADWVEAAWRRGARFDAWTELFLEDAWRRAASDVGIDPAEIAQAQWETSRVMPWAHISTGVTTRYLALERKRAAAETTTPDCTFEKCTGCGACQALDCDNMLAGVRSTPSAPAVAAGEATADVTSAQSAQAEVGDAPASKIAPAGAETVGAPSSAAASPAAAEVLGNDSSAEAASDERPLPASEGGAR